MNPDQTEYPEIELNSAEEIATKPKRFVLVFLAAFLGITIICFVVIVFTIQNLNEPSNSFPTDQVITISEGTSVREITSILEEVGVVKSKHLLYYALVLFHEPTSLKASNYLFDEPITTTEVATRLTEGDFDTDLMSFTHFEGERTKNLAARAALLLPEFDEERFITNGEPLEGKLFPDTYFIPPSFTDEDLLSLMLETFDERINQYAEEIEAHPMSLEEILILASIIEREANTPESMNLVSSVLQNRIEIGMALQADASIEYILDKPLSELTPDDLKIDSPYNTYLYRGLPPTPIGNPGENSILAVLRPSTSDYFYYITDPSGTFHFAETYDQHLINIEIYLR